MFFGGSNGVTGFFPEEIKVNPHVPPVAITAVSVFNRNLNLSGDFGRLQALELGPKDTVVSFAFAALSYSDPQRNRYAYKIDGLNHGLDRDRQPPRDHAQQPAARELRFPGQGIEQPRRLERAGRGPGLRHAAALVADLVVPPAGLPAAAFRLHPVEPLAHAAHGGAHPHRGVHGKVF